MTIDELIKRHTLAMLHLHKHKAKTARILGITTKTLYNWLNDWGIEHRHKDQGSGLRQYHADRKIRLPSGVVNETSL